MSNRTDSSEKQLDESQNNESREQGEHRVPPNRVARRLPNGEIPTSKNTLRSFESSSYPQPITSATAIVNSEKPSSEATGEIVNDDELDTTEFSAGDDDPVVDAIAAPILEEAEAILYVDDVARPENPTVVEVDENPTPQTKSTPPPRNQRLMWMILVAVIVVVGVIVVAVAVSVSCMDGKCGNGSNSMTEAKSGAGKDNLSPTNSTGITETTSSPTTTRNSLFPTVVPTTAPSMILSEGPSASPSSVDDTVRANLFIDFINVLSLTVGPIRNARNGTAEDAALNWLITSDPWSRTSLLETASERFRVLQRYALSTLFLGPTNDQTSWGNTSGWLVEENECLWRGINCTAVDFGDGAGPQMAVTSVNLQQQNFSGTLSSDLGLLSSMQNFEIYDNEFVGTIPTSLDRWTNLTTFYVYRNEFTGTIPFTFGQWSKLQQLSVTFNQLTGTLPSSIVQWTNLIYFSVADNQLNGTIPIDVGQWTNLDVFILRHNLFSGTLPSTIGQWTVLQYFNITENQITGTIPEEIGRWSLLQTLTLRDNLLTGTLPTSIGSFTKMWYFDVSSNYLNGTIPALIGNWSARMLYFALDHNNFTGFVPLEFCNETIATLIHADCVSDAVTCDCCTECF